MSTYWGYRCISHSPALESEHWHNHGEDELIELLNRRPQLVAIPESAYATMSPEMMWLREHPSCKVLIVNEYGDTLTEYNAKFAHPNPSPDASDGGRE